MRGGVGLRRRIDPFLLGAVLLALGTVVLAGWVSINIFDRLPHVEDEVAFVFQARTMAAGDIVAEPPTQPEFFRVPFVIVRDDMWFGKYPPGYPLVLSLGVLGGAPWLVNPILGGLAILLVFITGRRLYDPITGLGAAALLAVSPFLMLQAGSFMSHVSALIWTLLTLLAFESVVRRGATRPAVACGAALGMLALTRSLTAAGIGLPIGIWLLAMIVRDRQKLRLAGMVAAGALPFIVAILAYNHLTTGSFFKTGYELWWDWDRIGFGEGISRDRNYTLNEGWDNFVSNFGDLSMYLFGWPGRLSLIPAGIATAVAIWRAVLWRRKPVTRPGWFAENANRWDLFLAGTVVSLMAVHIIYWTDGQMYGPRYYFEIIGALALLSSRGLLLVARWIGARVERAGQSRPTAQAVSLTALVVLAALLSLHSARYFSQERFDEFRDWYDINRDDLEKVEDADLSNAVVFVNIETWSEYAPFFLEFAPNLNNDVVYAIDRGTDSNRRLMSEYPGRDAYVFQNGRVARIGD